MSAYDIHSPPHAMAESCGEDHCYVHGVHEPGRGAYRICFECNHAYPSARALRRDVRRKWWRVTGRSEFGPPEALWRRLRRIASVRASRQTTCPHCLHDF